MSRAPVKVAFPLRGEWTAAQTPAECVPSHGTDMLAQTYAFDFIRIERDTDGFKFAPDPLYRYLLFGVKLSDCYGYADPICAPFSGTVVTAEDGWPERQRLHPLRDLGVVIKNGIAFNPYKAKDLRQLLGNHVILKSAEEDVYAFFAHARCGSLQVSAGDEVEVGQKLAEVGHSGNSTAPHLHFQLMDGPNILEAKGLPCRFACYEQLVGTAWTKVVDGIPGKREFIRDAADPEAATQPPGERCSSG